MNEPTPTTVESLEELLSRPSQRAVATMAGLQGDLLLLGVGGKMGPTLARMAVRACEQAGVARRVIGVSRFSDLDVRQRLESWGVETISADLLDEQAVQSLPEVPNVIYMTGMKFGASRNPELTWAMNCYVPALVCRRFAASRIVAFSSGNVYPLVPLDSGGSVETDELAPLGEYSMTVLGRERMFQYFSKRANIPTVLLRLNYATELRYGVLVDIAQQVYAEQPVDVATPVFNVIWQADANAMTLAALDQVQTPANIINLAGPEMLRIQDVVEQFAQLMNKPVRLEGAPGDTAYLNNGRRGEELLGRVSVDAAQMIRWTAEWVAGGGASLGKPTHFQERGGKF
jgi:nucleoside-diphosphate-sugar epimerase